MFIWFAVVFIIWLLKESYNLLCNKTFLYKKNNIQNILFYLKKKIFFNVFILHKNIISAISSYLHNVKLGYSRKFHTIS